MAAADSAPDLDRLSQQLADAVERAAASTVRVVAGPGPATSGIAFAPDLVLTADHGIEPEHEGTVRVGLPDGSEVGATLVGRDPATDLAVLRVEATLTPATAGEPPRAGALALVVARPRREAASSLALISSLGGPLRTPQRGVLERVIYVDAVLYPGFSGGPLVDTHGAVLGMNTSGLGIGGPSIAVPWDLALRLAAAIVEHGQVTRGYVGIGVQPIVLETRVRELAGGQERGLLVLHVAPESPAARAGLLQGDILVKLDGTPVPSGDEPGDFLIRLDAPPGPHGPLPPPPPGAGMVFERFVRRMPGPGLPHQVPFGPGMAPVEPPSGTGDVLWFRGPAPRPFEVPVPGGPLPIPPGVPGEGGPVFFYRRMHTGAGVVDELQAYLGPDRVGATLAATIIRGGVLRELQVTVAPREEG